MLPLAATEERVQRRRHPGAYVADGVHATPQVAAVAGWPEAILMLRRASAASALTSDPLPRRSITTTAATSAFHEPNLTDSWFKDRLPLTALGRPAPAPLPKGARRPLPLSRFAGEGWGGAA